MNQNLNHPNLTRVRSEPEPPLRRNLNPNRSHAFWAFGGLAAGVLCRLLPGPATRVLIGVAVVGVAVVGLVWAARRAGVVELGGSGRDAAPDDAEPDSDSVGVVLPSPGFNSTAPLPPRDQEKA